MRIDDGGTWHRRLVVGYSSAQIATVASSRHGQSATAREEACSGRNSRFVWSVGDKPGIHLARLPVRNRNHEEAVLCPTSKGTGTAPCSSTLQKRRAASSRCPVVGHSEHPLGGSTS